MRARLVDRPDEYPGRCYFCAHSAENFGPYLAFGHVGEGGAVFSCSSCTATAIRALDVVPLATYKEAVGWKTTAEQREHALSEQHGLMVEFEKKIARLEGLLEGARSERDSLKHSLAAAQKAPATARREALLKLAAAQAAGGGDDPDPEIATGETPVPTKPKAARAAERKPT